MRADPPLLQIIRSSARAQDRPGAVVRREGTPAAEERCEVCGAAIDAEHDHIVDLPARALLCACRACYLLFAHEGAGGGRLRAVPRRYAALPAIGHARHLLDAFDLPIGLAFFLRSSTTGRVTAFYPSPGGAMESELPLDAWDALVDDVPLLATLATDVEALLIRRRDADTDAFIVPIDACYELVGRIRRAWRGFTGGDDVSREIDRFFAQAAQAAGVEPGPIGVVQDVATESPTA